MQGKLLIVSIIILFQISASGQFGYGFTASNDLYHRYVNPKDSSNTSRSSGSALLNLGLGPKIWIGNPKFSVSLEAQAVIGFLGFATKDYKGLGTVAFPLMAKLNFKGLSTFDREGKLGFSIGGGIQYNRTELYGLSSEFVQKGTIRTYFKTYVVQAGYGFGLSGFTAQGIVRYGFNSETNASSLNIGLQYDFNAPMLKKITNPDSEL
ncbi:MAG: hypothetical protein IPO92_05540 [Saprospiraceae bacterium]|nr:hypothetical protein [Saprospiraceae bacterium]